MRVGILSALPQLNRVIRIRQTSNADFWAKQIQSKRVNTSFVKVIKFWFWRPFMIVRVPTIDPRQATPPWPPLHHFRRLAQAQWEAEAAWHHVARRARAVALAFVFLWLFAPRHELWSAGSKLGSHSRRYFLLDCFIFCERVCVCVCVWVGGWIGMFVCVWVCLFMCVYFCVWVCQCLFVCV